MNAEDLHPEVWAALQARRERLPHALLMTGHAGIGKFELARRFAAGLLCETPDARGLPCGGCQACHWLAQGNHPDFRLIVPEAMEAELGVLVAEGEDAPTSETKADKKASQEIKIDQIRALETFLNVGTHRQGLRIVLLYPAEAMNRNTANSILKSLEEPSASTLFLLVSSNANSLLPTIRSRCQQVLVGTPSPERSTAFLKQRFSLNATEAQRWLALAGHAPLLAGELASHRRQGWLDELVTELGQGARGNALEAAARLEKALKTQTEAHAARSLVDWVQKWVHDLCLVSAGQPLAYFVDQQAVLQKLSTQLKPQAALRFYRETLLDLKREADHPLNLRLFLEAFWMRYQALFH